MYIRGIYIKDPDNIDKGTQKILDEYLRDDTDALWNAIKHKRAEVTRGDLRDSNEMVGLFKTKKKEKTAGTNG